MATARVTPQSWHIKLRKARRSRRMSQREMENRTGIRHQPSARLPPGYPRRNKRIFGRRFGR